MRSLFFAIIPSIAVAAEIAAKEPVDSNNVFMATFHSILLKLYSMNKLVLLFELIIGLFIVWAAIVFIKNRYQKQKLRYLKATYTKYLVNVVFFCIAAFLALCS